MTKKLKIEGIDTVGILNSTRPMSETLKGNSESEKPHGEQVKVTIVEPLLDIDEAQCLCIYQRESNL